MNKFLTTFAVLGALAIATPASATGVNCFFHPENPNCNNDNNDDNNTPEVVVNVLNDQLNVGVRVHADGVEVSHGHVSEVGDVTVTAVGNNLFSDVASTVESDQKNFGVRVQADGVELHHAYADLDGNIDVTAVGNNTGLVAGSSLDITESDQKNMFTSVSATGLSVRE